MSRMKDLMIQIQEQILRGTDFETIAGGLDVPIEWVYEAQDQMVNDSEFNDSMDGDAASALASAGFGTDEDYGYY